MKEKHEKSLLQKNEKSIFNFSHYTLQKKKKKLLFHKELLISMEHFHSKGSLWWKKVLQMIFSKKTKWFL